MVRLVGDTLHVVEARDHLGGREADNLVLDGVAGRPDRLLPAEKGGEANAEAAKGHHGDDGGGGEVGWW